jgi:hypothetical protein
LQRLIAGIASVLLGAAASFAQTPASTSRLQSLVNDTAAQLQLVYRHNRAEHQRRREQLVEAIAAWRTAERSSANNERLADWLRDAIRSSMPGSREQLPPLPEFSQSPAYPIETRARSPRSVRTIPAMQMPATANSDKSFGDPFRDDAPR